MAGPDKEQVDIAKTLAPLMERVAAAVDRAERAQSSQLEHMQKLVTVMGSLNTGETVQQLNEVSNNVKQLVEKMSELAKVQQQTLDDMAKKAGVAGNAATALTGRLKETQTAAQDINKTPMDGLLKALEEPGGMAKLLLAQLKKVGDYLSKKFPTSWAIAAAAASGFYQGLKNMMAIGKGVLGFLGGMVDTLANVAGAIIAIPFKMFKGLIDIANGAAGGSNELAQAIENIRKEFGALDQKGPQAIKAMATNLKGFEATGLSAWRVFGNMAQRLEEFLKLSQEMGPTFENFAQEFSDNGGALLAWQKGLGLSGEMMGTVAKQAMVFGTTMSDQLMTIQKQAMDLGKQFGIASKHISRDMVKAMADVKHFAGATVKEMAQAAVYARKLGLELDKITGTLDAFETFDSAAENASKLSQAFGVNVDAFQMMEAQDPAKQIEMLRKQMAAAGQDASTMNRQQLKLLASSTGLSEEVARQAFSMKNAGVSLDDIKKKSEGAEKKQLSQAEAMSKLADSIERLVQSGGGQQGGFFDRFFHGFLGGIQASKEFRGIIFGIQRSLRVVELAGVKLGKAFVEMFPGVKDVLGGIRDLFNPKHFGELFNGITQELTKFFKGFTKGEYSFAELMKNLKEKFFNFFNKSEGAGKKVLDGFKDFFGAVSKITAAAIKWMSDKVKDVLVWITDVLTGKVQLGAPGAGGAGFLGEILAPLLDALKYAWKTISPVLWDLIKVLANKLFEFLKTTVLPALKPFVPMLAGTLFGPALARAALASLATALGKGFIAGAGAIFKSLSPKLAEAAGQIKGAPGGPDKNPLPSKGSAEGAAASGQAMTKGGQGISWPKVGMFLVGLAGVIAIGMAAVFGAIAIIRAYNISGEEIMKSLAILGTVALATLPVAAALFIMSKVPLDPVQTGLGILAIGLSVAAMAGVLGLIYLAMKDAPLDKLMMIAKIMWEMSKVFAVAAVIIAAATAIGAFIVGTSGIGAAIIAAGMAAIAAAIGVMAVSVIDIMKKLNDVPMGPGFKDKVDAFAKIMDAVTNFAKNISAILEAVKPSFITLIKGKDDTVERITKVTDMITAMIGKPGGGGLIGLIEKIVWALQQMAGGDERMLEGAKVMADILNAMASMANSLKPPDAMFKAVDSMWSSAADVNKAIELTTKYADQVAQKVEGLIDVFVKKVMPFVSGGNSLSDQQIKGAAAIGQLLGSVVQIAQGMQPSQGTIQAMRDISKNIIASGEDSSLKPENMEALGKYVNNIAEGLKVLLPAVIGAVEPLLRALGNWHFSESDAKAAGSIGVLLQQMFVMIQSVVAQTSQFGQAQTQGVDKTAAVQALLDKLGAVLPGFMASIGNTLPLLFDSVKAGMAKLSSGFDAKQLEAGMKTFGAIMGIVSEVPKMMKEMQGGDAKDVNMAGKGFAMAEVITQVAQFFGLMIWGGKFPNGNTYPASLPMLAKVLADPSIKALSGAKGNIDALKMTFGLVNEVMKVVKEVKATMPQGSTDTAGAGFAMAKAISEVAWFFEKIIKSGVGEGEAPLSLLSNVLKLPVVKELAGMKTVIEPFKAIFTLISDIIKVVSTADITGFKEWDVAVALSHFAIFMQRMLNPTWPWKDLGTAVLPAISNALSGGTVTKDILAQKSNLEALPNIFSAISSVVKAATPIGDLVFDEFKMATSVAKFAKFMKSITAGEKGASSPIADIANSVTAAAGYSKQITTGGIAESLKAINDMVTKATDLNEALGKLPDLKLPAKLKTIADGVGLGGKFNYQIKSKDVVININMSVEMNAADMEKALVLREKSIIRNRLNFATEKPSKEGDSSLPASSAGYAYTPVNAKG